MLYQSRKHLVCPVTELMVVIDLVMLLLLLLLLLVPVSYYTLGLKYHMVPESIKNANSAEWNTKLIGVLSR